MYRIKYIYFDSVVFFIFFSGFVGSIYGVVDFFFVSEDERSNKSVVDDLGVIVRCRSYILDKEDVLKIERLLSNGWKIKCF